MGWTEPGQLSHWADVLPQSMLIKRYFNVVVVRGQKMNWAKESDLSERHILFFNIFIGAYSAKDPGWQEYKPSIVYVQ